MSAKKLCFGNYELENNKSPSHCDGCQVMIECMKQYCRIREKPSIIDSQKINETESEQDKMDDG